LSKFSINVKINKMESDNKLKNKNVETFAGDMVKAIESDRGGLIKKIIQEEEKKEAQKKNLSPKSAQNKTFLIVGFLLLIITFLILIFLFVFNKNVGTALIPLQHTSVIFTDQTIFKEIDSLSKDKIANVVLNEKNNTKTKIGGIESIYLTENKKVIDFSRFILLIKGSLNSDQLRLFYDNFLLGIFKSGLNSSSPDAGDLFILLKVKSFTDIFPIMQVWENKMLYDFYEFFEIKISPETNYLFTKDWEEDIVSNKNARILRDNTGKIILMYVYADDNSIIVTDSENAINEVVLRLNSSKIKK